MSLLHIPSPPISSLVDLRYPPSHSRRRCIASLHGCILDIRPDSDSPPTSSHCLLEASVADASASGPGRLAISVALNADYARADRARPEKRASRPGRRARGTTLKLYLFTSAKHSVWLTRLREAAAWKVETFYRYVSAGRDGGALPPSDAALFPNGALVGAGLFAEVWGAVGLAGRLKGVPVAVKVVQKAETVAAAAGRPDLPIHPKLSEFVGREARLSRTLSHPDIARVFDVFETPYALHIVMQRYPLSLKDLINTRGRLQEDAARNIVEAVLRALLYLHDADIVHRDVNVGNVLLTSAEAPYGAVLCDFGLANFVDRRAARVRSEELRRIGLAPSQRDDMSHVGGALDGCTFTSAVGAPAYIAPEVVECDRYGAPVDAWGVGVVLYYLLSGTLPFGGSERTTLTQPDPAQVLDAIRDANVVFEGEVWEGVSNEAKTLIRSLLVADQRRRISVEAAMEHPWFYVIDNAPLPDGDSEVDTLTPPTEPHPRAGHVSRSRDVQSRSTMAGSHPRLSTQAGEEEAMSHGRRGEPSSDPVASSPVSTSGTSPANILNAISVS